MLSSEDIADMKKEISSLTDNDLKAGIAYLHWVKVVATPRAKEILGDDYTDEYINKIIDISWQEVNKRGIPVKDVQDTIYKIAQGTVDQNTKAIKEIAAFNKILAEKKQKKDTQNLLRGLLILVIIGLIIYFVYKGLK